MKHAVGLLLVSFLLTACATIPEETESAAAAPATAQSAPAPAGSILHIYSGNLAQAELLFATPEICQTFVQSNAARSKRSGWRLQCDSEKLKEQLPLVSTFSPPEAPHSNAYFRNLQLCLSMTDATSQARKGERPLRRCEVYVRPALPARVLAP